MKCSPHILKAIVLTYQTWLYIFDDFMLQFSSEQTNCFGQDFPLLKFQMTFSIIEAKGGDKKGRQDWRRRGKQISTHSPSTRLFLFKKEYSHWRDSPILKLCYVASFVVD